MRNSQLKNVDVTIPISRSFWHSRQIWAAVDNLFSSRVVSTNKIAYAVLKRLRQDVKLFYVFFPIHILYPTEKCFVILIFISESQADASLLLPNSLFKDWNTAQNNCPSLQRISNENQTKRNFSVCFLISQNLLHPVWVSCPPPWHSGMLVALVLA